MRYRWTEFKLGRWIDIKWYVIDSTTTFLDYFAKISPLLLFIVLQ